VSRFALVQSGHNPDPKTRALHFAGVVRVADSSSATIEVVTGDGERCFVPPDSIRAVDGVRFWTGDAVAFDKGVATVRSVGWHREKSEPIYLLEFEGKELSKRYWNNDLTLVRRA